MLSVGTQILEHTSIFITTSFHNMSSWIFNVVAVNSSNAFWTIHLQNLAANLYTYYWHLNLITLQINLS